MKVVDNCDIGNSCQHFLSWLFLTILFKRKQGKYLKKTAIRKIESLFRLGSIDFSFEPASIYDFLHRAWNHVCVYLIIWPLALLSRWYYEIRIYVDTNHLYFHKNHHRTCSGIIFLPFPIEFLFQLWQSVEQWVLL